MPTNIRDPRTIITPDAFGISPDLLGTPLAGPWRRFWALLVDLILIGLISGMLEQRFVLIWGAVGLFLIWMAFRRSDTGRRQPLSVMLRGATGCLGLVILLLVGGFWFAVRLSEQQAGAMRDDVGALVEENLGRGFRNALEGVDAGQRLSRAETAEEAEEAALTLLRITRDLELSRDEQLELLLEVTPSGASWRSDAEAIYRSALSRYEEAGAGSDEEGVGESEDAAEVVEEEVARLSRTEVLAEYARLLEGGELPDTGTAGLRARALRRRAAALVAADTVEALAEEVDDLREELEDEERARRRAEAALEEDENELVALVRDIWEQLGSAIGIWSIYFTVVLTVFNGQTVGKRLLSLRVMRLDGEPMSWWYAFERGGGYVAGLATGLLGFAQVFWDPNRQCVHDKIVGTVVVDERLERAPGAWEEAWEGAGSGPAEHREEDRRP